jgi:hypothetical protein
MINDSDVEKMTALSNWFHTINRLNTFPRIGDLVSFIDSNDNCIYIGAIESLSMWNNTAYLIAPIGDMLVSKMCAVVGANMQAWKTVYNKQGVLDFVNAHNGEDIDDDWVNTLYKAWCIVNNKDL